MNKLHFVGEDKAVAAGARAVGPDEIASDNAGAMAELATINKRMFDGDRIISISKGNRPWLVAQVEASGWEVTDSNRYQIHIRRRGAAPKARSWTGRTCCADHDCSTELAIHMSDDGVRWRGNADDVPDCDAKELPANVRRAFLAYIEATANGNDAAKHDWYLFRNLVVDLLAKACGVVFVETDEDEEYWAGPWESNLRVPCARDLEQFARHNAWVGAAWGCSWVDELEAAK